MKNAAIIVECNKVVIELENCLALSKAFLLIFFKHLPSQKYENELAAKKRAQNA